MKFKAKNYGEILKSPTLENTIEILNAIKPQLHKHFPNVCFLFGEANYIFVSLICGFASIVNLPI